MPENGVLRWYSAVMSGDEIIKSAMAWLQATGKFHITAIRCSAIKSVSFGLGDVIATFFNDATAV
jgi:hypothetical protein